MKKTLILFTFFLLFIPSIVLAVDFDKSRELILDGTTPWREKVKLIDEIAPIGSEKVLDVLATVYDDGDLHFGCPAILYHTVSGLRYFRGDKKALQIVRDGINSGEPEVRMISLEVLGIIGSTEDIDVLKPFLRKQKSFEAYYAQTAIDKIKARIPRSAL